MAAAYHPMMVVVATISALHGSTESDCDGIIAGFAVQAFPISRLGLRQ
ncbi:hypothetical protein P0R31_25065 [Bradyrhizobium yuanmingense]|nr:hypothetical protein [Bradyrhizobium yuanmingense]MDF0520519.1 hypothetical protein [Bradyrhizobium yuanmingense]